MAKEKTAKEINEILSGLIDEMTTGTPSADQRKKVAAVTNMIGKINSSASLELRYWAQKAEKPPRIPSLDRT